MQKKIFIFTTILIIVIGALCFHFLNMGNGLNKINTKIKYSKIDKNKNGIPDCMDIVNGAKEEVKNKTKYKSEYYIGGYPPKGEGVCTDVIWRAFMKAGINLKSLVDEDIRKNPSAYPRIGNKPDPNIDFRRVPNLDVFFRRHCLILPTNSDWQPGDIVVFTKTYEHIAIISDKVDRKGIPYVLHNSHPHASEAKLSWFTCPVHAHYRWKY